MDYLWYVPSALIAIGVLLGPVGVQLGALSSAVGWGVFSFGLVLAILSAPITAAAAAFASSTGRAWRGAAVRAAVIPLLAVGLLVLPNQSRLNPVIHDISTDPADTLQFDAPDPNPSQLPREQILEMQRSAYTDLAPLEVSEPADQAFERAVVTAESMPGWRNVRADVADMRIHAEAVSRVFRFVDDVVIRVRPEASGEGAVIDMRSRSRFGQSDLGTNADRIRSYFAALRTAG